MKKLFTGILAIILCLTVFMACGNGGTADSNTGEEKTYGPELDTSIKYTKATVEDIFVTPELFDTMPPVCPKCGGLLKPDFVFFGEPIPLDAQQRSLEETLISDVWLVIGTTGEIMPASMLPYQALQNGATILEINIQPSNYTREITKVFLEGKATVMMELLLERLSEIG